MKNLRIVLIVVAVLGLVVACNKGQPQSPASQSQDEAEAGEAAMEADAAGSAEADDPEADAEPVAGGETIYERGTAFMEEVAAAGIENIADCDEVEAAWRSLVDENQELLEAMRELAVTQTYEEREAFVERYGDRIETYLAQMTEVLEACQDHNGVMEVVDELATS